jgi:YVTN family beta-propeller protein
MSYLNRQCLVVLTLLLASNCYAAEVDRSPVDLSLSPDGRWLVTANETSDSISLIRTSDGKVIAEAACGDHPAAVEFCPDGETVLVTSEWSGDVTVFSIADGGLKRTGLISVGFEPCGLTITRDGKRAFVGLVASGQVAEIDLSTQRLVRRLDVGSWPRYLTLSADDSRLAVGCSGESQIHVLDVKTGKKLYHEPLAYGINIGHMIPSADGKYAYFPWMVSRTNPINVSNLRKGWLLASRIGRVRLDGPADREAISLDVPGLAVADPHGIVISRDDRRLVASSAGTHEVLVYRLPNLPFIGAGGPGDLIDRALERDRDRFQRIEVGGRPMGLQMADDNHTLYVANYLQNSVQVVDLDSQTVTDEIALGGPADVSLARRGMEIFYDGERSLDQWYSCHSCHQNGGTNSRAMDTLNDGTEQTFKTVLPLHHVTETGPWTWHGWQQDLDNAMHKSITSTMLGKAPSAQDKQALLTFLETLEAPPNPFRNPDGSLTDVAERGRQVFESDFAACAECHNGPHFSDGKNHDVGLNSPDDFYENYNTPSLLGTYRKVLWLHTGRARSLERVVTDLHSPEKVAGTRKLTEQEAGDLIEYLKSL